ncbi:MAG: hypothetical protein PUE01_11355 [Clostridiaceae bacterium]|nr:hypothetical protein [Clostridiaceae bacterium]
MLLQEVYVLLRFIEVLAKKGQVEFDNNIFYLECRDEVSEEEYLTFMRECCDEGEEISADIKKGFIFVELMIL